MVNIIEYNQKYNEEIKDLLVELQEYIVSIDKDGYNIITSEYKEEAFKETMLEINDNEGKIFLANYNDRIVGLIIGIINNKDEETYDFRAPKRGRITELIITEDYRSKGLGELLINTMENYLKNVGCKAILIEVFGYNESAKNFYSKHGYSNRNYEVMKLIEEVK